MLKLTVTPDDFTRPWKKLNDMCSKLMDYKYFSTMYVLCLLENAKLKPEQVLKFVTGTEVIPPLGLPTKMKLQFVHGCQAGCRCRPSASTCALQLRLPVHYTESGQMVDALSNAIIEGAGLDLV